MTYYLQLNYPSSAVAGIPIEWDIVNGEPDETYYITTNIPEYTRIPPTGTYSLDENGEASSNTTSFGNFLGTANIDYHFQYNGLFSRVVEFTPIKLWVPDEILKAIELNWNFDYLQTELERITSSGYGGSGGNSLNAGGSLSNDFYMRNWSSFHVGAETNLAYKVNLTDSPYGNTAVETSDYVWARGPIFQLEKTYRWNAEFWVRKTATGPANSGSVSMVITDYNSNVNIISQSSDAAADGVDWHYPLDELYQNTMTLGVWTKYRYTIGPEAIKDHSANARFISLGFICNYPSGGVIGNDTIQFAGFSLRPFLVQDEPIRGPEGFKGSRGITGFTGSIGDPGPAGTEPGPTGLTGFQGSTGARGLPGYRGCVGEQGPPGDVPGPQGEQGLTGYRGSQGEQGIVGYRGSAGVDGSTGKTGYTGSASTVAGPTGYRGSAGRNGENGTDGRNGTDGTDGQNGQNGTDGQNGQNGATGSQGPVGFRGSEGDKGQQGDPGGPQGIPGTNGQNGKDGFTGSVGLTGSAGKEYQGSTGYTGSIGYRGSEGYKGSEGYRGSEGYFGSTGYQGSGGFRGSVGARGVNGFTGCAGIEGPIGPTGYRGSLGTDAVTFLSYANGEGYGNEVWVFEGKFFDQGNGYNQVTGLYTAPTSGYYHVHMNGLTRPDAVNAITLWFQVNGSAILQSQFLDYKLNEVVPSPIRMSTIVHLEQGDTISVFVNDAGGTSTLNNLPRYSNFGAFLIGK